MYVYVIKAPGSIPMYKIGKANDPGVRLRRLQTGSPVILELIFYVRCKSELHAKQVEKYAHGLFDKQRRHGEWFRPRQGFEAMLTRIADKVKRDVEETAIAEYHNSELDKEFRLIIG